MSNVKEIKLIGRIETDEGAALILCCDERWVVAYPNDIDITDGDQIDALHTTYLFPKSGNILPKAQTPHDIALHGFEILHHHIHGDECPRLTPATILKTIYGEDVPDAANEAQIIQLSDYQTKH